MTKTGGIDAILVDSSALPEQVVNAVTQSAFGSAGQRCSAPCLMCLQEVIADHVIEMIQGVTFELVASDPADLASDLGPVVDQSAFE